MRLYEIENKYFNIKVEAIILLEGYLHPEEELKIEFSKFAAPGVYYADVKEKTTERPLLTVIFTLNKNGSIDMDNIIPADDPQNNKIVHTSIGTQYNGVDIGIPGIRWIMRKLKEYAASEGYVINNISSQTRYTGIRAKNNSGADETGLPKNFEVARPLKETIKYDCINDTFTILKT